MKPEFWQTRWKKDRQGFDQDTPNPLLTKYFSALNIPQGGRVLVPLCGKSIDMLWLAGQGYDVIGAELVEEAVIEFFTSNNIPATLSQHPSNPHLKKYTGIFNGQKIQIWVGDIFNLMPVDVGDIDAVYDRAAIVALTNAPSNNLRDKYVQHLMHLTDKAPQLVLLLGFDGDSEVLREILQRQNPPFVVTPEQFTSYYCNDYDIKLLLKESADVFTNYGDSGCHLAYALLPQSESQGNQSCHEAPSLESS